METTAALLELAGVFLACRDRVTLLKSFAARAGALLGARAVLVWLADPSGEGMLCSVRWTDPAGERWAVAEGFVNEGLLAEISESAETRRFSRSEIVPDDFSHLDDASRKLLKSAVYVPLPGARGSKGVVEVLNKSTGDFTFEDARFLEEASRLTGDALTNLELIESERSAQLTALERLTSLYDLGRNFTSTLELGELLPIVTGKIRDILGAGVCNLWLVDAGANELYLAQQVGEDSTVEENRRASATEGLLGEIVQLGKPKLVEDPAAEPSLEERRKGDAEFEIRSWMAAPLRKDDEVLGVVELLNRSDGKAFDEDDLFFLESISEQAAAALHNAKLLESERKLYALDALLKISREITSTLDLDHVLTTVVHQAATVVPFDSCVIGFFDRGRFVLGAVSGESEVPKTREMDGLRDRLRWVAEQKISVSAELDSDGWHVEPEDARGQIVPFLEEYEYGSFYALSLRDDQGTVGAMVLLRDDSDFLLENDRDIFAILANQTTVAIRNAQLYQQVPLANLLQPLAQRKQKLLSSIQGRWVGYAGQAGLIALFFVLVPWPLRIETNATVVPAERRIVSSIEGGVAERVFVHEGDAVQSGQFLAQLNDGEARVKLAQATAALAQAKRDQAEAEFRDDPSTAGQAKIRVDLHTAEVRFEEDQVAAAQLRAPITGIVVTPKVEDRVGTMVKPGEGFCEIVAQDRMAAQMSVPETDVELVRSGRNVAVKLNALPTEEFEGTVDRIGTQTRADAGEQYFLVRAVFDNLDGQARDGMVGRARIRTGGGWFQSGWYPLGYVLLRSPFRAIWQRVWSWLP